MSRAEASGDQRVIAGKLNAKYDPDVEAEVIGWIRALLGENIEPGRNNVEKTLRSGVILVRLIQKVQEGTANCPPMAKKMRLKPNTMSAPFKQMENIQTFLTFCERYGMPKTGLFQTVDLYEGRNMAQVMSGLQQLGTECQRNGFQGPTIGARPTDKNVREFTADQLKAGQGIIGLQAGTNKCASQSGMSMGAVRHVADIRADEFDKSGSGVIGLQAGSNKGASQSGMSMGAVRHVSDIRADDFDKAGSTVIGLQAGSNKGASQSGMSMGAVRHVADIRADDMSVDGANVIGLQAGSNKGASQRGMAMGSVRHVSDIKTDAPAASTEMGLQMGSNKFATQKGMGWGRRHAADTKVDASQDMSTIGLQMGTNKGASQTGMTMGGVRHVADIRADNMDQTGQGVINLQYGTNQGATQTGMDFGGRRHVAKN